MDMLKLKKEEILTRGGILDKMMDSVFDASTLVDRNGKILQLSHSTFHDYAVRKQLIGQDISVLDNVSPFHQVLETGQPAVGLLLEIHGRNCISSIHPIYDGDKVIGALGTILFRDLRRMKKIFADTASPSADSSDLYDRLSRMESGYSFSDFIGDDPVVKVLINKAQRAAQSKLPILIIGETGTGKEIIAGAIHNARALNCHTPYVTINCTAIPENLLESELFGYEKGAFTGASESKEGKFELAAGGDILLDEIGDMNLSMQSKLLRVLESKEFERVGGRKLLPLQASIIASTNRNLFRLSEEKKFRPDLYYRLNTIELFIPPLRSRPADIPLLIEYFSEELSCHLRLSPAALRLLTTYSWPGNVRQLRNLVQRLSIFYENRQISEEDIWGELHGSGYGTEQSNPYSCIPDCCITPDFSEDIPPLSLLASSERNTILKALEKYHCNISAAARELGMSRGTLYNKMRKYEIDNDR